MIKKIRKKIKFYLSVNWIKTIYFNFKVFPFSIAKKLPVFFYGKVKFNDLNGTVLINSEISKAMIGFGQRFEKGTVEKGISEISISGKLIFNGNAHIGKDFKIFIEKKSECEFGYMSCLGSDVKLICTDRIKIGDWTGIGFESQIIDSTIHPMIDLSTNMLLPLSKPIILGTHNAFSNRISIMAGTITPNYCVITSNSLLNKDYRNLGNNFLIGGIPAKLIKNNYTRDWVNEMELLKKYKIIYPH
jgi:acetyltransferase-like isoleucine patch superfamily enzyme